MLCDDVKRVIYFFLDGSVGEKKRQDIEIHLKDCPDCEVRIYIQRKLRSFVRSRLSRVDAPETLRIRLTRSLRAVPATE